MKPIKTCMHCGKSIVSAQKGVRLYWAHLDGGRMYCSQFRDTIAEPKEE